MGKLIAPPTPILETLYLVFYHIPMIDFHSANILSTLCGIEVIISLKWLLLPLYSECWNAGVIQICRGGRGVMSLDIAMC